jgi:hypothetical protein
MWMFIIIIFRVTFSGAGGTCSSANYHKFFTMEVAAGYGFGRDGIAGNNGRVVF